MIDLSHLMTGAAGALIASTAVRALPEPLPMGSRMYLWFYRFAQGLLSNWDLAKKKQDQ